MTEKKYIYSFVTSYWKYWLVAMLFGLGIGLIVSARLKPSFEASAGFLVKNETSSKQNDADFYLYDGYYAEQTSVQVRNNFVSWLVAPRTVQDIYAKANVVLPSKSTADLSRLFKLNEVTNTAYTQVSLTHSDRDSAQKLVVALTEYAKENFKVDNGTLVSRDPLVVQVDPPKKLLVAGMTFIFGFGVFMLTLLSHYFKDEN